MGLKVAQVAAYNTNYSTPSDISSNIVIFGESIPKGINIRNLNTRLSTANCICRFFDGATSKRVHHYIQLMLNETNVKTDTAVNMGQMAFLIQTPINILLVKVL